MTALVWVSEVVVVLIVLSDLHSALRSYPFASDPIVFLIRVGCYVRSLLLRFGCMVVVGMLLGRCSNCRGRWGNNTHIVVDLEGVGVALLALRLMTVVVQRWW